MHNVVTGRRRRRHRRCIRSTGPAPDAGGALRRRAAPGCAGARGSPPSARPTASSNHHDVTDRSAETASPTISTANSTAMRRRRATNRARPDGAGRGGCKPRQSSSGRGVLVVVHGDSPHVVGRHDHAVGANGRAARQHPHRCRKAVHRAARTVGVVPTKPHRHEHQNPDRHDAKHDQAAHRLPTGAATCGACSRTVTLDRSDGCDEHIGGVSAISTFADRSSGCSELLARTLRRRRQPRPARPVGHFFVRQRVREVVTPVAGDMDVALASALEPKARASRPPGGWPRSRAGCWPRRGATRPSPKQ